MPWKHEIEWFWGFRARIPCFLLFIDKKGRFGVQKGPDLGCFGGPKRACFGGSKKGQIWAFFGISWAGLFGPRPPKSGHFRVFGPRNSGARMDPLSRRSLKFRRQFTRKPVYQERAPGDSWAPARGGGWMKPCGAGKPPFSGPPRGGPETPQIGPGFGQFRARFARFWQNLSESGAVWGGCGGEFTACELCGGLKRSLCELKHRIL